MDQIEKEIIRIKNSCKDFIDDRSSSLGRSLLDELQKLEDEAQMNKGAKTLENRARSISRKLNQAGDNGVMSSAHADMLESKCENLVNKLRKM